MEAASSSFIIGSSGLWKHDYDLGLYGTSMIGICYFMAEQYWEAWGLSESVVFHVFYLVSCWFLGFCWCLFWVLLFCVFVAFWWHLGSRFTYILIVGINNLNQRIDDRQSSKRARHRQKKKKSCFALCNFPAFVHYDPFHRNLRPVLFIVLWYFMSWMLPSPWIQASAGRLCYEGCKSPSVSGIGEKTDFRTSQQIEQQCQQTNLSTINFNPRSRTTTHSSIRGLKVRISR